MVLIEMILIIAVTLLILCLFLFLIIFMPLKMCELAELKGYNSKEKHIFALCFWFGIFGFLYVVGLPDLKLRRILLETSKKKDSPVE